MKNLKISNKLIVSFLIVIALAVAVGAAGIIGMQQMNAADDELYNINLLAIEAMGKINVSYQKQRSYIRNIVLYDAGTQSYDAALNGLKAEEEAIELYFADYEKTIDGDTVDQANFDELKRIYHTDFAETKKSVIATGAVNDFVGAREALSAGLVSAQAIEKLIATSADMNKDLASKAVQGNTTLFTTMTIITVVILLIAIIVALFFAFYVSGLISKPVNRMKAIMDQTGSRGDFSLDPAVQARLEHDILVKDEIGQSLLAFKSLFMHIISISQALDKISNNDLTGDIKLLSEQDTLGNSMKKMQDSLNNMFSEINNSTNQVSTGSKQIADGAQSLAQGSTQQAAAVEQLSSSINEIATKTADNAVMAGKAATLSETIRTNAQKGSSQMDQMMVAVKEINEASQSINKVIKVIDDIAFQTNILALNAAVEAARAGQHGKGFAVVAEEVRNLAAKSASAAKDTGSLIANSMEKAQLGARIAEETSASLNDIVKGINESTGIISDIARSSEEQSAGIRQINTGIDQVAQVVQQNSATAEQSAAASEEMSGQSHLLEELVSQFKLKNADSKPRIAGAPRKQLSMPQKSSHAPSSSDFGKY